MAVEIEIERRQRVQALDRLAVMAKELQDMSQCLDRAGEGHAAVRAQDAETIVQSLAFLVERPALYRLEHRRI